MVPGDLLQGDFCLLDCPVQRVPLFFLFFRQRPRFGPFGFVLPGQFLHRQFYSSLWCIT